MRGGTNWRSIIQTPAGAWAHWFVEVTDYDGAWHNLGYVTAGDRNIDFLGSYDLEDDIDRNTLTFSATLRGSVGAFSLMPFRSDSPLNVDTESSYQPLIDLHREWKLWVCFTPRGTFPEGPEDYRERARGIIDRLDLSFSRDEIRLQGRGPEADLIDHLIIADEVTPKVYGPGPVADVLQEMLDDQFPGEYTLVVDGSAPSTYIDEMTWTEPVGFWKLFSDTAAVGTGVVRFKYDDSDVLAIHLFTPDREADIGDEDWSVGPDEYSDIDNGLDLATVGNFIVVRFVNASGAIESVTAPASLPSASSTRYGKKSIVINLDQNTGINDATRAQALADAILADRELPILGQVVKGTGLWFGWLWDYVGTPANGVLYNEDQAGGVVAYHESGRNSVIDNTFTLAGKPKGRYTTWLELDAGTAASPDAPAVINLTMTRREILAGSFYAPAIFAVASVNETALSVTFEFSDDLTFASVISTTSKDVVDLTADDGWAGSGFVQPGVTYYVRATPYSGVLSGGSPTGTAGVAVIATSATTPEPTDTPTVEWDLTDPSMLRANVIGSTVGTPDDIVASLVVGRVGFFQSVNGVLILSTIPTATTEVVATAGTVYRQGANLSGAGLARLIANIISPAADGEMAIEYRPSGGSFTAFTPTIDLTQTGIVRSDYEEVPEDMANDVDLRPVTAGGGDTATVSIASLTLEFAPSTVTPPGTVVPDVPEVVQSGPFTRVDGDGSVSLATPPTIGNYMLLLMTGFGSAGSSDGAEPPAGWTTIIFGEDGSNGSTTAQKLWAAYKVVTFGETGVVSWTGQTDITNMAIFEVTPFTQTDAELGTATTGAGTWSVPFGTPPFSASIRFVFYEHDSAASVPAIDGGQGITTLHTFDTPTYVNHFAVLGLVPNGFNGTITGTSTGSQNFPAYMTLSLG